MKKRIKIPDEVVLTPHQQRVIDILLSNKGKPEDVTISSIYMHVYGLGEWRRKGMTVRKMQQKLAPTFAAINAKIDPLRIQPGKTKQTYRLIVLGK